jgi:hypothetical protein
MAPLTDDLAFVLSGDRVENALHFITYDIVKVALSGDGKQP